MTGAATLLVGRAAIAEALDALWNIVGDRHPGRGDPEGLQRLIDRFLDEAPAPSVGSLEHRLRTLAAALDQLGPWASDRAVLERATELGRRLN